MCVCSVSTAAFDILRTSLVSFVSSSVAVVRDSKRSTQKPWLSTCALSKHSAASSFRFSSPRLSIAVASLEDSR